MKSSIIHLLIFLGCSFAASVAVAQETGGRLEGTARDTAGIPLAGAVVALAGASSGDRGGGERIARARPPIAPTPSTKIGRAHV